MDSAPVPKDTAVNYCLGDYSQCDKYATVEKQEKNPYIMPDFMATDCQELITCEFLKRALIPGPRCIYQCVAWEKYLTHSQLDKCLKYWDKCPIRRIYLAR